MSRRAKIIFMAGGATACLTLLGLASAFYSSGKHNPEKLPIGQESHVRTLEPRNSSFVRNSLPARIWRDFLQKVDRLRDLDMKVGFLRERLAEVELESATLMYEAVSCQEDARAHRIKEKAVAEGGLETARTIASLRPSSRFRVLLKQPPNQIFETAASAFVLADYETAGKGFSYLVEELEDSSFKTAQTYYLGAVSLYRLGNYKRAKLYFQRALEHADPGPWKDGVSQEERSISAVPTNSGISYAPRALAWVALCNAKLGDRAGRDHAIRELIQKYPKSKEARRLNRNA